MKFVLNKINYILYILNCFLMSWFVSFVFYKFNKWKVDNFIEFICIKWLDLDFGWRYDYVMLIFLFSVLIYNNVKFFWS